MIVKNEADVIERCLDSVADLVDEIIIVDTGSTDRTKILAARYTKQIFDFEWIDDFAAARNFAFAQAKSMYCMWLDADDVFLAPDRLAFAQLKAALSQDVNAVMMKYNTGFDEKGNVTFSYYRERIIKRSAGMQWVGAVHEVIPTTGKVEHSACAVTHQKLHPSDPDRNLRIFEKQLELGTRLDPRQQFYYGRELYYHKRYDDAIGVFTRFLDEDAGWVENKIDACKHCAYCHSEQGDSGAALQVLLRSFLYDLPRAEICCDIGHQFFQRQEYPSAIYWYERAMACRRADDRGGFVAPDAYGYIPCIQLCVCHSRMGNIETAVAYNERAAAYKPDAEAVAQNRVYFATLTPPNVEAPREAES